MTPGHSEAQQLFSDIGTARGFRVTRSFNEQWPTDGVWWHPQPPVPGLPALPLVACEAIVSETGKTLCGSVSTLEKCSPALAVLILHDEEIRRRLMRQGGTRTEVDRKIHNIGSRLRALTDSSRQRFSIWTFNQLCYRHRISVGTATSSKSIYVPATVIAH